MGWSTWQPCQEGCLDTDRGHVGGQTSRPAQAWSPTTVQDSRMLRLNQFICSQKSCNRLEFQSRLDKTGFKNKPTVETQRKPHPVRSRVLPVLLLGETVAEVFGCKSGIHINNLEHKRAALKINVMGSTPAAQGQRSKNFLFFFFLHLTNEWNDTNLVNFDDSEQHLDLLWARPWGQDAGTEREIIQTSSCLHLVLQNKRLPSWHKSQLWAFISKVTVLQVEHMYLHIAFHEVAQNRERTFKKQIQFKRNFANRFNKFTPCPQVLIRMGNAAISSQSWEFWQQC